MSQLYSNHKTVNQSIKKTVDLLEHWHVAHILIGTIIADFHQKLT